MRRAYTPLKEAKHRVWLSWAGIEVCEEERVEERCRGLQGVCCIAVWGGGGDGGEAARREGLQRRGRDASECICVASVA